MDCTSEESLVRMALSNVGAVRSLSFDLLAREVRVVHLGTPAEVLAKLAPLGLGATVMGSAPYRAGPGQPSDEHDNDGEARTLRLLLALNAGMFVIELVIGLIAQSTGLVADSLDMFADAAVYVLALYAVGKAGSSKLRAAHVAGWLQVALAIGALAEVVHRAISGSEPMSAAMMALGALALVVNATCLVLLARRKNAGAHLKASYIFSATDVIANAGVILAGVLVAWTGSALPDLVIGTAIALVVLNGARRILGLR